MKESRSSDNNKSGGALIHRPSTRPQFHSEEKMKTNLAGSGAKSAPDTEWTAALAALFICFVCAPVSDARAGEPIMITGGAQEGSGGVYHLIGAVEPMYLNGPVTEDYPFSTGIRSIQEELLPAENLPVLQARLDGARFVIFWPLAAQGFVLQRASRLGAGAEWTDVPAPYATDGTHAQAAFDIPDSAQFFRLHRP
jgi:hypothetical protein